MLAQTIRQRLWKLAGATQCVGAIGTTGETERAEDTLRQRASPLRLGLWLALVLVAAKAALLGAPRSGKWPLDLAMASFMDVLFALAIGAVGEIGVRATARHAMIARTVRYTLLGLYLFSAGYSVVAVGVFEYFGRPLNYDLLRLVGNIRVIQSSIAERITVPKAAALVLAPWALFAGALWASCRRRLPTAGLAAAFIWIAAGFWQHTVRADDLPESHLWLSPHVELFRSTFVGLIGPRRPLPDFPPEDTVEFRPFQARGPGAAGADGFEPPAGVARPRNVIVIVLESVGTRYLSLYGSRYDTTPNLAAESAHALVFDNFYAHAPYTYYSFSAINFSVYPGLPWRYAAWADRPLPPPLAWALRERGWRTAYLHSSDLDWDDQRWLLQRRPSYDALLDYRDLGCAPLTRWKVEDGCLIDRLIRWIDEQPAGAPGFLAVCWTDQTHDPYLISPGVRLIDFFGGEPPPRHAADLGRYLNVLRETDRHLGRLFAALRQRGLADDTLVAITGDHGEAFSDPHDHRGHCMTLYEEVVHVPLMLWNPRLFASGRRVETVGAHVDLNPTIADLLGIQPPGGWQGHSLFDPSRPPRAYLLTNIGEYLLGVREGDWKYILNATAGQEMLFDLSRDRDEQHDAAAAEAERCRRLQQRIAAWVSFEEEFLHGRAD
jgi:hypothetical protein